jgi:hypothetical protein
MSGDKGSRLPLHKVVLQRGEELLRFRQRQAEVLDLLARLIEDNQFMDGFFLAIICTYDELHLEPHGAILLPG